MSTLVNQPTLTELTAERSQLEARRRLPEVARDGAELLRIQRRLEDLAILIPAAQHNLTQGAIEQARANVVQRQQERDQAQREHDEQAPLLEQQIKDLQATIQPQIDELVRRRLALWTAAEKASEAVRTAKNVVLEYERQEANALRAKAVKSARR